MSEEHLKTREFQLEGFHCKDCASTIETTVRKIGGVHSVRANFVAGKVTVQYDPRKAEYEDLVRSVERIGYHVKHGGLRAPEVRIWWRERAFLLTLISGVLLGLGLFVQTLTGDPQLVAVLGRSFPVSTVLYLAAIVCGAYDFSREGWAAVRSLRFNMDFLMTFAIIGAVVIQEYVEAASLAFLFSLAELLESFAVERARTSLRELMKLTPDVAHVKGDSGLVDVAADEVQLGQVVVVRPGEKIPVDGEVIDGVSSVDQSPITGESVPVRKEPGEGVYAGSVNVEGALEVRVSERPENTMLARIVHLVEEAEAKKAPSERFVEKFARVYTPAVVALAVGVATVPPLFFAAPFNPWFVKALTLLVIACPCALVISTPVTVVSALTSASRNGVLIKGGVYLEEMAQVRAIAFDKTGTLTKGKLKVTDVVPLNGRTASEVLQLAASLEARSEHPIARAILEASDGHALLEVQEFRAVAGKGVTGKADGTTYYLGRPELFATLSVPLPESELRQLQSRGRTTMLVGSEREIFGLIALTDELRTHARETVAKLQAAGKEVVMITGDNPETARAIAEQLGISHYHAALLPEQKVEEITYLRKKYGKVAMVGDGINDAPALAAANVGIVMGAAGTYAALETGDIALMADDLTKLPYLVEISQKARGVIKENITASIVLKLSLAVGVFPGVVSLVLAVLLGDMGASLAVTANAMRLARVKTRV